jgi:hypothetical protein
MRYLILALALAMGSATPADAQVSVGFGVDIGIEVPVFPQLVLVPGYPVYYDPRADSNYFFYDGMYWVYEGDSWYASSWYNGPWRVVEPEYVPLYVLRVPVRYYRQPPPYFRAWRADAPPRWGERWGHGWERRRAGWDRWDRRSVPRPAPLPVYQRQYGGDRYPRAFEQQRSLGAENYRYRPRETFVREHFDGRGYSDGPRGDEHRWGGRREDEHRRDGPRDDDRRWGGPREDDHRRGGPRDDDRRWGGPRDDDRRWGGPRDGGQHPGAPRAEPQGPAQGPLQPHEAGRAHDPGRRDDARGNGNDGRGNGDDERGHGRR